MLDGEEERYFNEQAKKKAVEDMGIHSGGQTNKVMAGMGDNQIARERPHAKAGDVFREATLETPFEHLGSREAPKTNPCAEVDLPEVPDFDPAKERADGGGLRFSEGKNAVNLIRPLMMWGLGNVFTRGAIKYASNNWMRGMDWSEVLGPLERHVLKWKAGEVYDKDTGCHHMFMVAWNALVLAFYQLLRLGVNNTGTAFDYQFVESKEIDAFDMVNNKPEAQYRKEVEEMKKKREMNK